MIEPTSKILSLLGWNPTGDLDGLTGYTTKRGKVVWFLKAPPTCPATQWQIHQRNKFRLVAAAWKGLTQDARQQWSLAEQRGRLNLTGYNLFTYWSITHDDEAIRTVERQTDTTLIS